MRANVFDHLLDYANELGRVEGIVGEFLVRRAQVGMFAFVLWRHFAFVLPRKVLDAAQTRQIRVAIFVLAVVDFEHGRPVGQKQQVRQAGAVHAHEYVRVVCVGHLVHELRFNVVRDYFKLDFARQASVYVLDELILIKYISVLSASRQKCNAQLLRQRTLLINLKSVQDMLGKCS